MKTFKEFPATHSMSTAWYIADADGNVAFFDFEENGPVPVDADPDNGIDADFLAFLGNKDDDGIPTLNFTDEQIEDLISSLHNLDNEMDYLCNFVEINTACEKEFREIFKCEENTLCFSRKKGIYYIAYPYNLIKKGIYRPLG